MGNSWENLGKYGKISEDHGKIMPNSWENHLEIFVLQLAIETQRVFEVNHPTKWAVYTIAM